MILLPLRQTVRLSSLFLRKMSSAGKPLLPRLPPCCTSPSHHPPPGRSCTASFCFLCLALSAFISAQTCPGRPLDAVIVQPTAPHTATMIFLHGLGDSGHGWSQAGRSPVTACQWAPPPAASKLVTSRLELAVCQAHFPERARALHHCQQRRPHARMVKLPSQSLVFLPSSASFA